MFEAVKPGTRVKALLCALSKDMWLEKIGVDSSYALSFLISSRMNSSQIWSRSSWGRGGRGGREVFVGVGFLGDKVENLKMRLLLVSFKRR
jgi:hypothetical protein